MGWVLGGLFLAPALQALDVQIDRSFVISGIVRKGETVTLPREHKKYYNVRILDKDTLHFVQTCPVPCVQPLANVTPVVQQVRAASTSQPMWLVSVAFARAWLVTFRVTKEGARWQVEAPANFKFLDDVLAKRTREGILQAVEQQIQ